MLGYLRKICIDFFIWQSLAFDGNYTRSEKKLLTRVRQYNAQKVRRQAKVVVYTAIIGGYELLMTPEHIVDDWDYVCFSDTDIPGEHIFEIRKPDYFNAHAGRTVRFVKIQPHLYFPKYEYSVWLDANIMVRGPHLENSVKDCFSRNVLYMGKPHSVRNCIYAEAEKCIALKKDSRDVIETQVERYRKTGFPAGVGLLENGIIIRRHNDPRVVAADNAWWDEIEKGSHRDQLSNMYILWKQKLPYETLKNMKDFRIHDGNDYCLFPHGGKSSATTSAYVQPSFMRSDKQLLLKQRRA